MGQKCSIQDIYPRCLINPSWPFCHDVNPSIRVLGYHVLESSIHKNKYLKKKWCIQETNWHIVFFFIFHIFQITISLETLNNFLGNIFTLYVISQFYFIASIHFDANCPQNLVQHHILIFAIPGWFIENKTA